MVREFAQHSTKLGRVIFLVFEKGYFCKSLWPRRYKTGMVNFCEIIALTIHPFPHAIHHSHSQHSSLLSTGIIMLTMNENLR